MQAFNFILLIGPLLSGLLITVLVSRFHRSITELVAIVSSFLTAIFGSYFFLSNFFFRIEPESFIVLSINLTPYTNRINLTFQLDSLSTLMVFVASFLGFLIVIFSTEYMTKDVQHTRYYFFVQLFIVSMIILVSAGDFIMMFIGWELVGLCSFFLIAHWNTKDGVDGEKCSQAGMKAFIFTRFGDIGFLSAIIILYTKYQTLTFSELLSKNYDVETITVIGLLFVFAAFGKSAQIPFMPWLSSPDHIDIDAMQGPTTVSALIHAATMVKAGIYLISRMFLIFPLGLSDFFSSWSIIVIISGLTAVIAGFSAIMSIDFKRILAYSTVSQLAFMFLSIGLAFTVEENHLLSSNAFYATQLHLLAHAFFKSLLFLSAGYIIHTYHTRNLNELRGILNWEKEKYVLISFLIGCFALVGLPPMNGFFSKEAIIDVSYEIGFVDGLLIGQIAFFFIVLTAILTALYTGKMLFYLTFNAKGSKISDSRHNSVHKSIIMPSIISLLGLLTVITAIFSFYIPDFFNDVISSQPFEIIKLNNLLIPLIILILIIISLALSIILLKDYSLSLNKLSSVFGISIIYELSKNGFYFDQLIMFIWDIVQKFANKFKHLHPGDLNYTVFLMSGFSFLLLIIFMIGGL